MIASSYDVSVAQGDGDVGAGRQFRIVRHEDDGGLAVAIDVESRSMTG
jgi:hypothetical protein